MICINTKLSGSMRFHRLVIIIFFSSEKVVWIGMKALEYSNQIRFFSNVGFVVDFCFVILPRIGDFSVRSFAHRDCLALKLASDANRV